MFLDVAFNIDNILYTTFICGYFVLAYFVIIATRIESLFKQGKVWQIKAFQIIISIIIAYFLAQATFSLYNSIKF